MKILLTRGLAALSLACLLAGAANAATIEMTVNGLVCAFCAQGIEKRLKKFPATAGVLVSLESRLVAVALKGGQDIADGDLTRALTEAGYDVKAIRRTETPLSALKERVGVPRP